jgi:hypothetical protein
MHRHLSPELYLDRTYGPFSITYSFSPETFVDPYITFTNPKASASVTKVTVTKR